MTAEPWLIGEVSRVIDMASDESRLVSVEEMRNEIGAGHDDLVEALDELRVRGDAVEGAPSEWRRPYDDESIDAVVETDAAVGPQGRAVVEQAKRGAGTAIQLEVGGGQVVLTAKVLAALTEETIGAIVRAGVEDAGDDVFTLTVRP